MSLRVTSLKLTAVLVVDSPRSSRDCLCIDSANDVKSLEEVSLSLAGSESSLITLACSASNISDRIFLYSPT